MVLCDHALVCGCGDRGLAAARSLIGRGTVPGRITTIDIDERRAASARLVGLAAVTGDARSARSLGVAHAGAARLVVVSVPDAIAPQVVAAARAVAPDARICVVLKSGRWRDEAAKSGASEIVDLARIAGRLLADSIISRRPH
jgi:voltage-gated potassium channel Kch